MRIESACSCFRRRESSVLPLPSRRSGAGLPRLRRRPRWCRHKKKGPDIKGSETGPEERPSVGRVTQPKGTRSGRKAGDDAIVGEYDRRPDKRVPRPARRLFDRVRSDKTDLLPATTRASYDALAATSRNQG